MARRSKHMHPEKVCISKKFHHVEKRLVDYYTTIWRRIEFCGIGPVPVYNAKC